MKRPIPIAEAAVIASRYGYDQVVIIARAVGEGGGEHVTTFGSTAPNSAVAASIGDFLKHKIMGWPETPGGEDLRYQAFVTGIEDILDAVNGGGDRLGNVNRIAAAILLEARGGPERVRS